MLAPFGLISDSANPVPPPNFWTMAVSLAVVMMPSMVSSSPRTKHADSVPVPWPSGCWMPAFIRVGELGTNSRVDMTP